MCRPWLRSCLLCLVLPTPPLPPLCGMCQGDDDDIHPLMAVLGGGEGGLESTHLPRSQVPPTPTPHLLNLMRAVVSLSTYVRHPYL